MYINDIYVCNNFSFLTNSLSRDFKLLIMCSILYLCRNNFLLVDVSTVFWFKNDGPFAGAFLMIHLFFFLSIFFLYIYWLVLLRKIYTTKEITYTFSTYCVSSLRQFFYFFFCLYLLVIVSFIINYWRFPIEFLWILNYSSWFVNFISIVKNYFFFLINLI